mmetsp:Transcript_24384/g.50858  ORF Transcript_24384/g.50858 Transcript_24384/m.50858 type:complete len:517 (-) Transcript_24384:84-1634(-)|eukprot:CAMPEP_0118650528 /NCGR_PEP_ID=MMETSP0785-20121206/10295_1 /TAXON_ID=91992 /ORGANISM="Bolidomonas pacifica, Strain CCMP 1866" /LENGTH=516 /DNA_ID=CAMNT_0006542909 /DNA_START=73 /DNA_END=1623 /DNA_ORIENTATION=-
MVSAQFQVQYRQPIMTAQKIEQLEAHRRATEAQNKELLNYVGDSTRLSHAAKNEIRVSQARRTNTMARVAAENLVASNIKEKEYAAKMNSVVFEQNARLATEISLRNAENERMEREIQRMCDTSEELKELERKLNIAYVNKERAAQHQEALLLKSLEQAREMAIDDQMEYERQLYIKKEMDKEDGRREKMMEQKSVLQKQILDRQVLAVEAREEAERDKEMVEAIVAKINEQDRLEIVERNRKKEETRALVKFFQEERERKKAQILEEERQQEAEIKAYYDLLAQRLKEEDDAKKAAEAEKKRRWAKVVEETKNQNESKEEFSLLRDMLWEEELEAKRIADDKERVRKREEDKKKMMEENQIQLANKKKMIAEMEAEEERLVQVMLAKFAKDEEAEKAKQQKRVEMQNQYKKNIKGQKEERYRLYEIEKSKELAERDYAGEMEEYRLRVVAEARKRLLQQHAAKLKGFLPKGAIQNEEEAAIVRSAADLSDHTGRNAPLVQMQSGYPGTEDYKRLR